MLVQISWECTPPYLSTEISNLLQPAQAEVVLGQCSMYLASWGQPMGELWQGLADFCKTNFNKFLFYVFLREN
jgi:hypothetical protein